MPIFEVTITVPEVHEVVTLAAENKHEARVLAVQSMAQRAIGAATVKVIQVPVDTD